MEIDTEKARLTKGRSHGARCRVTAAVVCSTQSLSWSGPLPLALRDIVPTLPVLSYSRFCFFGVNLSLWSLDGVCSVGLDLDGLVVSTRPWEDRRRQMLTAPLLRIVPRAAR